MKYSNRTNKLKIFFYVGLVVSLVGTYIFFTQIEKEYLAIKTFQDCVDAGYPVLTTYPEQCKIPGKVFTNTIQVAEKETQEVPVITSPEKNMNPKNASYDIEGQIVQLSNGTAVTTSSSSVSNSQTVKYFGNELRLDVNGDGKEDTALLLTTTTSGTGTFYYLVVALNKDGGYIGTNGVFLGDRIAPQSTEFKNGEIVVNYAERKPEESMSTKPSIAVSRYFKITDDTLVEIQK